MNIVYPVRIERPVYIDRESSRVQYIVITKTDVLEAGRFRTVHGDTGLVNDPYRLRGRDSSQENDGEGLLLTNLVGLWGGTLQKWCPGCHELRRITDYGVRTMGNGQVRDQSNCGECRRRY